MVGVCGVVGVCVCTCVGVCGEGECALVCSFSKVSKADVLLDVDEEEDTGVEIEVEKEVEIEVEKEVEEGWARGVD